MGKRITLQTQLGGAYREYMASRGQNIDQTPEYTNAGNTRMAVPVGSPLAQPQGIGQH